jgi:hypothetical protein
MSACGAKWTLVAPAYVRFLGNCDSTHLMSAFGVTARMSAFDPKWTWDFVCSGREALGIPRGLLCSLELIVQANQSILDVRFSAENTIAPTGCKGRASRTKAHEVVFSEHRPVWREHPLGTGADCPTGAVV